MAQTYRLGAVAGYATDERGVTLDCGTARLRVGVVTANIVRLRVGVGGDFAPRRAWAVNRDDSEWDAAPFTVGEEEGAVSITTAALTVRVVRATARVTLLDAAGRVLSDDNDGATWTSDGAVAWTKHIPANEHYYGCGERTGMLDKLGRAFTCWTTDPYYFHTDHGPGTDEMYQAIPFFMALRPGEGIGYGLFFNNSYRSRFDFGAAQSGTLSFSATGGEPDYYVIAGPTPAQIVEGYTAITGRMALPPLWTLGYQQCRWSYMSADEVREIARQFRARAIPCDTIVLNIDYMRGYRVFTWDKARFADPAALLTDLTAQGFKLVTIIDPGVKNDPGSDYAVYQTGEAIHAFIRQPTGEEWRGCVWPGDCVFPDFSRADVRAWWGGHNGEWIAQGVAGIWNDMNEPAVNDSPFGYANSRPTDPPLTAPQGDAGETTWAETHNLYALHENAATHAGLLAAQPDTRPFILTRAGFAGIQRYAAVWTGDNSSLWEHLEMAIPQLANLGLSGVAFVGADIGGFIGNATADLFARWVQVGAFYPFSRGHSVQGTARHEPWVFGEEVERISRRYLTLRYRLLPYLYSVFEEAARTGAPVWRPLLYHFPDDPATAQLHDQVMVGDALLLAPVYRPGQTRRRVYLPAGVWYDYWSGQRFDGPVDILADAPLDTMPLYVRGGTVVTHGPVLQYTDEKAADALTYSVNPDAEGNATARLYEDDGRSLAYTRGESATTTITCQREGGTTAVITGVREGNYTPPPRTIKLRIYGLPATRATLNGQETAIEQSDDGALILYLGPDTGTWEVRIA